jgi:hypothetical protein
MRRQILIVSVAALAVLLGACQTVSAAPSPITTMLIWNTGSTGHLDYMSPPATVQQFTSSTILAIPAGTTIYLDCPLAIPTKLNGNSGRTGTVYLRWTAPATCSITSVVAASGSYGPSHPTYIPGTAYETTVTYNLGSSMNLPQGLGICWGITNSGGSTEGVYIWGSGAKIRY